MVCDIVLQSLWKSHSIMVCDIVFQSLWQSLSIMVCDIVFQSLWKSLYCGLCYIAPKFEIDYNREWNCIWDEVSFWYED
jgi:hypothetical protein